MLRIRTTVAALLSAALLAGCGGSDEAEKAASTVEAEATQAADSAQAPDGAIDVELAEWKVEPATATAGAGTVTFNARNVGEVPHELEVISTDTPAGDFPVESGRAEVEGEEVGEVEGITVGQSKPLEVELEPGHYALICNLPGHYEPGMYADFEVR